MRSGIGITLVLPNKLYYFVCNIFESEAAINEKSLNLGNQVTSFGVDYWLNR